MPVTAEKYFMAHRGFELTKSATPSSIYIYIKIYVYIYVYQEIQHFQAQKSLECYFSFHKC